jgi:hypothetical protein
VTTRDRSHLSYCRLSALPPNRATVVRAIRWNLLLWHKNSLAGRVNVAVLMFCAWFVVSWQTIHTHNHTQHYQPVNTHIKVNVRIRPFEELGSHSVRTFECSFVFGRVSRNLLVWEESSYRTPLLCIECRATALDTHTTAWNTLPQHCKTFNDVFYR